MLWPSPHLKVVLKRFPPPRRSVRPRPTAPRRRWTMLQDATSAPHAWPSSRVPGREWLIKWRGTKFPMLPDLLHRFRRLSRGISLNPVKKVSREQRTRRHQRVSFPGLQAIWQRSSPRVSGPGRPPAPHPPPWTAPSRWMVHRTRRRPLGRRPPQNWRACRYTFPPRAATSSAPAQADPASGQIIRRPLRTSVLPTTRRIAASHWLPLLDRRPRLATPPEPDAPGHPKSLPPPKTATSYRNNLVVPPKNLRSQRWMRPRSSPDPLPPVNCGPRQRPANRSR